MTSANTYGQKHSQTFVLRVTGRYRDLWASHASHAHGVIFVVDVTDRARIAVAREELHGILTSRGAARCSPVCGRNVERAVGGRL